MSLLVTVIFNEMTMAVKTMIKMVMMTRKLLKVTLNFNWCTLSVFVAGSN